MDINQISSIESFIPSILGTYEPTSGDESLKSSFAGILQDALQTTMETDIADKGASLSVLASEDISLHEAMIASTEAELSLRLTLEIRNKIVDAYTEIMRMQV